MPNLKIPLLRVRVVCPDEIDASDLRRRTVSGLPNRIYSVYVDGLYLVYID